MSAFVTSQRLVNHAYGCRLDCTIPNESRQQSEKAQQRDTNRMVRRRQCRHLVPVPRVLKEEQFHLVRDL